jgi:hypothetical protein
MDLPSCPWVDVKDVKRDSFVEARPTSLVGEGGKDDKMIGPIANQRARDSVGCV